MQGKYYKIGEAANKLGITAVTLRHYQKIGLLKPSFRSESGYRLYMQKDFDRLIFVINAKKVGFSLQEIQDLFSFIDTNKSSKKVKDLISKKQVALEDQIQSLNQIKHALKELDETCSGTASADECPIIRKLRQDHPHE